MVNRETWHDDMVRVALASGAILGIFLLDLANPPDRGFVQFYPAALLPLYGAQHRKLMRLCCGAIVGLLIAGMLTRLSAPGWLALAESRVILAITVAITAIALDVIASREQHWRQQALVDPLTGVLNRRSFMELSGREDARARRGGRMLSVLMLDIDHFKKINDTYGHPAGDGVIKRLAETCAQALRPSDIVGRYGGEEFIISLPETEEKEAQLVAERLRRSIADNAVSTVRGPIRITVSIGLATSAEDVPLADIIQRADTALYQAKTGGRNRVEIDRSAKPATAAPRRHPQPAREPPPTTTIANLRAAQDATPGADAGARSTILVVDDDNDIRDVIAEWLDSHGYQVLTAADADEALRMLETDAAIELLCTDIVMPGELNGLELGRRAEQIRPNLKLLYMSAHAVLETLRDDPGKPPLLLNKPFRLDHFLTTIEGALLH
jgi:diguanylate cyclase (GGDEF)-like protein